MADCHVLELYMNNCVYQMYLSAEVKEELAIPNGIRKNLLKVDRSPIFETPTAMLSALLGTWEAPDGRSKVKGNASNEVRDESELWKCVFSQTNDPSLNTAKMFMTYFIWFPSSVFPLLSLSGMAIIQTLDCLDCSLVLTFGFCFVYLYLFAIYSERRPQINL